jgi:hypothetical protein
MKPFKFYDIEQNTDEWFDMRGGVLNGSKLGIVMANFGKAFGEPAKRYAVDIAIEQITGRPTASNYSNSSMDFGHEQEPVAVNEYEQRYFCEVSNGGFFKSDFIGCSPDGLLYDNGVIEIKSAESNSIHYQRIRKNNIDSQYKWQCIGNLKFTGRDYLDFISWCPSFPDERSLFVKRIETEQLKKEFEMIETRVADFRSLVNEVRKNILTRSA